MHHRQVEWYLAKANAYPEKRRKQAAAHVAVAKHRLYKAEQVTKQIAAAPHHCCGHVFVTFDTVEAAQACIEAARSGHKYFQGFGPLEMRAAPEAEDVIWENLQCSRWERGFRSLAALLAALAAVTASTAAITYSSLQQTSLMCRSAAAVTTRPGCNPRRGCSTVCCLALAPNPTPTQAAVRHGRGGRAYLLRARVQLRRLPRAAHLRLRLHLRAGPHLTPLPPHPHPHTHPHPAPTPRTPQHPAHSLAHLLHISCTSLATPTPQNP